MFTAGDLARLYCVPLGTIHRWAHEDGWGRTRYRPVRYSIEDAHASYQRRRVAVAA